MDIVALSMALSQSRISSQVNLAVTKMAMENSEQVGSQVVEMLQGIQRSVEPYKGTQIDSRI